MADNQKDIARAGSHEDVSRARKRKMKRQDEAPQGGEYASASRQGRTTRPKQDGPSMRERLVSTKVALSAMSLSKLEDELNAKLRLSSGKHNPNNGMPGVTGASTRKPHRKAEARSSQSMVHATQRSETQRSFKPETSFSPHKDRRVFEARSEVTPPVMVRGGMGGMAFGRVATSRLGKRKPPRRRIDLSLHEPGAEVRLPSIPLMQLGWRAVSLFMVLMMVASLFLIWKAPVFKIDGIEAVGLQRLTKSDLNAVMGTLGKSVFSLNPSSLRATLKQAFPEFSKVSVKVGLPASVKVVVTERQPIIDWIQDGSETWVDADGVSFPVRGTISDTLVKVEAHGEPPVAVQPILLGADQAVPGTLLMDGTAITSTLYLSKDMVSSILSLSAKMPPDTVLAYDSERGLGWKDPKGWEVYFGPEDQDMAMKLAVYQALVERLESEGIQPALISVEYVHAPYYRMER